MCHKVFPILPVMEAKESVDDILQLFAQSFLSTITAEMAKDIIQLLFDMLLVSVLWLELLLHCILLGDLLELLLHCII